MSNCYPIQVSGVGTCPFNLQILRRIVLVPLLDSNGDVNSEANVSTLTKAYLQGKFNENESLDRYYSLPLMENVEQPRAETTFFEYNSGNKARIKQGTRTFTGLMPDSDPQFLGRMQSWYNQDFGFYGIDKWGNFVYAQNLQDDTDTAIYPIPIDGASFDVNMMTASDSDPYGTMIQFDYKQDFNDAAIRYVDINNIDFDGRTSDFYGLLPITFEVATGQEASVTTVVFLATEYGIALSGLVLGEIQLYDTIAAADLNITDVAESATTSGLYTLTATTTIAGNATMITVDKDRYEYSSTTFSPVAP